jgi:hypothetical protein
LTISAPVRAPLDGAQKNQFARDVLTNEAEWLKRFVFERLGLDTPVRAVLALPG